MTTAREVARRIAAPGLSVARRRFGQRMINWTPEFMRFGNHLYLWAWAHAHRHEELSPRVLIMPRMHYWIPYFPAAAPWLIEPRDVHLLDQREHIWADPLSHSSDPRGFTNESRAAFIRDWLLTSPALATVNPTSDLASDDVLTVNVRRGDYYSDPQYRTEFAFDVAAYLRRAVEAALAKDGPVRRIHVVSDDVDWCRDTLTWLPDAAGKITFPMPGEGPIDNFRDVSSSRRLVISNSTFSIWGAATAATALGGGTSVWAPAFFQRRYGPGRCYEYDQEWNFIDELPGGFQPDWVLEGSVVGPSVNDWTPDRI